MLDVRIIMSKNALHMRVKHLALFLSRLQDFSPFLMLILQIIRMRGLYRLTSRLDYLFIGRWARQKITISFG